jgi:hypothetical protein
MDRMGSNWACSMSIEWQGQVTMNYTIFMSKYTFSR